MSINKKMDSKKTLIAAIDQGTSSTRLIIYQLNPRNIIASHQIEIKQRYPYPGWVEIDPEEIIDSVTDCINATVKAISKVGFDVSDIKAVGISNQRETTILWDRETGKPLYNAVVWLDNRTAELADEFIKKAHCQSGEHFKDITGLPINPYFSALKIRWLLDNVKEVKQAMKRGTVMFGTVDSWIIFKLTGKHITDVTNASRTLLMSIDTLTWVERMCNFFNIPMNILPTIHSSAEPYALISVGPLKGVPISGCLGDQQAALLGEHCLEPGETKCTYGTGTFMLTCTGNMRVLTGCALLTTVAYRLGPDADVCYALEGAGSIGGNALLFLRDNLQLIKDLSDVESAAASVSGTEGVVFVPCFTGLYSPYWDSTARGILCGLEQTTKKEHIIRAALEAVCFQTQELISFMQKYMPERREIKVLKVDGGMTVNRLFLQLLSDILGINVIRSEHNEASCWGAALAAAVGAKIISSSEIGNYRCNAEAVYEPTINAKEREKKIRLWKQAIQRSSNYVQETI